MDLTNSLLRLLHFFSDMGCDIISTLKLNVQFVQKRFNAFKKSMDRNKDGKLDAGDWREAFHEVNSVFSNLYSHMLGEVEVKAVSAITMAFAGLSCLDAAMTWRSSFMVSKDQIEADESLLLALVQLSAADSSRASANAAIRRIAAPSERGLSLPGRSGAEDRQLLRLDSICLGMHLANAAEGLLQARAVLRGAATRHAQRVVVWTGAAVLNAAAAGIAAAAGSWGAALPPLLHLAASAAAAGVTAACTCGPGPCWGRG